MARGADGDVSPVISVDDVTVDESQSFAEFTVRLSQAGTSTVTVGYNETNGTASNGSDYTSTGNVTLTFAPGETTKTVQIALLGDSIDEGTRELLLQSFQPDQRDDRQHLRGARPSSTTMRRPARRWSR